MKRPDEVLITAVSKASPNRVHAFFASNMRTVCSATISDSSNAEFELSHPDNCTTCERQVQRWVEEGRLV